MVIVQFVDKVTANKTRAARDDQHVGFCLLQ